MNIAGYQKQSLQDYPGLVSSIVFTKGCNFRCGYCHNPELISHYGKVFMDHAEIFSHLEKNRKMIDGVVVTGGEPTIQAGLSEFLEKLKELGMKVKLDTNGSNPGVLRALIDAGLVDYIAMDYKWPSAHYMHLVRTDIRGNVIRESRDIIMRSELAYEFRVTVIEKMFTKDILTKIAEELKGASLVRLQGFRNEVVFDKRLKIYRDTTGSFLKEIRALFSGCKRVEISQ